MFIHSNMPAVRVEELTKSFKGVRAVDAVSFDVSQGEIFSLLGSNGAGKTTTVNMLTTLIRPDAGRAWVGGASLTEPDMIRPNVSVTGQFAALDEELTGRTNLQIIGALAHVRRSERKDLADHLLQQFSLTGVADRPVRTYSGGMKRRLDIAVSLMARPRVLFLDEPTTGIDPENRLEVWGIVRDLASNGTTVFLTTQYLEEAEAIASRAVIMKRGKVIANGTLAELKAILPEATVRIVTQTPHEAAVLVKVLGQRGNTFESFETHRVRYSVAALGRHSYGIFLWHWPIATLLLYVFPQWRDPNVLNVGVVALALTALMTWVSHMWIELPVGDKGFFRSLMPTVKGKPREWVSWVAIVLILLFSAVGTVRAIQTAPAKTLTQILLEQNQGQNTEPAPPKPPLDTTDVAKNDPPDPIREMPDGTRLTAVGDSVMLAAKPALEAQFPGISVDATVSRAMPAGIGIVGTLQSQRALREYVVVGLATNSMVNTDQLDQLLATIGGGRILVLINAHGVRSWIPPTNDVLRQYVDSHSDNVVLVDWDKAASPK